MERELLTPEEVADVLRVGRSRVYELIGSGKLQSVKIGASRRIPQQAVRVYVAALLSEVA